jgi:membrane protease YdiL (CAAX protease family)
VLFALAIFLLDSACVVIADLALQSVHFYDWFYGSAQVEAASGPGGEVMRTRMTLWAAALAFPLWSGCVIFVVRRFKAVPAADIGLTPSRPASGLLLGCAAAVVLTPLVLGLNLGVGELFARILGQNPTEHPLTQAGKQGLFPVEWLLVAFLVMVSAPVREELLFRGVLQRLFTEYTWASHVGIGLALLTALVSSVLAMPPFITNSPSAGSALLSALMPILFVLAMAGVYVLVWLSSKNSRIPAVFATALLFGATHSFAWPTPVALFVLGLGLGYLALRTRSLLAPVVVHSLFNATSFVLLIIGWGS